MLIGALALLSAAVLIPSIDEYSEAAWQRDRALAVEKENRARIENHERYIAALDRCDLDLVRALSESQLNRVPDGFRILFASEDTRVGDASVFDQLEPDPVPQPERHVIGSLLERLVTGANTRPWVLAIGVVLLGVALVPASRR